MLEQRTYLVSELGAALSDLLDREFDDVWVSGTISGLKRSRAGHVYFDLIEPSDDPDRPPRGLISVALFSSNKNLVNKLLKRADIGRIEDGMQVRIRGAVDFFAPNGRLSLRMTSIDPTFTLAKLGDERDRVLRALEAEGLLDRNAGLAFPLVPQRVGLVTSHDSAAYHDFVNEVGRTGLAWHILLVDTVVQGPEAPPRLASAIRTLAARRVDVIAVVRGGGSKADLAAFDAGIVARAIAAADVPVVTGIGHDIDSSVADAVAHTAFKTPTACAAGLAERTLLFDGLLTDTWRHIRQRSGHLVELAESNVDRRAQRVADTTRRTLDTNAARLNAAGLRAGRAASTALRRADGRLDRYAKAIGREAPRALTQAERRLAAVEAQVAIVDPANALARGWSMTQDEQGRVIRSVTDVQPGSELVTHVADGQITSTVSATASHDHKATPT